MLQQSAMELQVSSEVLSRALLILQVGTDYGFLRTADAFDSERQRADENVAYSSTHDQLKGLPNRTLILDRVERMLGRTRRDGTPAAALMIGLDNFKSVNETLGRSAGDELLCLVAQRLDAVVRDTDSLGRLGSDEFIVIAEDDSLQGGLKLAADRVQEALKEPFALSGDGKPVLNVTASIGIAAATRSRAEELLRDADIAMTPIGVEALIRWRHPTRGVVAPNSFMPLLEGTGMIVEVGLWCFGKRAVRVRSGARPDIKSRWPSTCPDTLKIDRSFISGLTGSQESKSVIHALVQLGKALSIETLPRASSSLGAVVPARG